MIAELVMMVATQVPPDVPAKRPTYKYKVPEWTKPENRPKPCTDPRTCDCAYHRWVRRGKQVEPADPDIPVIIPAG